MLSSRLSSWQIPWVFLIYGNFLVWRCRSSLSWSYNGDLNSSRDSAYFTYVGIHYLIFPLTDLAYVELQYVEDKDAV